MANPVTIEAARIKDIPVWGTVQEGRVLPVAPPADGAGRALGPVPGHPEEPATTEAGWRALEAAVRGDACDAAKVFAGAIFGES